MSYSRTLTPTDRSIGFVIFGLLLACYLLTFTGTIQSSDGLSMFATAESMARRGEIDSNALLWMGAQQGNLGPDGELYSRKGLGMVGLALPLVWLAKQWDALGLVHAALLLNPLLTAWTGGLLYRASRRLGWPAATGVAVSLTFGLATLAWPYTQTFFSDPVCAWGLFAALYALIAYSQNGRKRYLVFGGTAWSVAYLARVVNLVTLPIFAVALIWVVYKRVRTDQSSVFDLRSSFLLLQNWRPLVSFALPVVLAGALSLWWNAARYGSVWDAGYVETETFSANWLVGVSGLLVGPARGLLWYSPVLILAVPGAIVLWRRNRAGSRWLLLASGAVALVYVALYGKWYMWHGGYSWGPRFLVPLMPLLALWTGPVWRRLLAGRSRLAWAGAAALLLASSGVQMLGLLVPFSLAQEWLRQTVEPLFAPETFTQLRYSPLVLQWQFLRAENIQLAWWQAGNGVTLDWAGLLIPLLAVAAGAWLLVQQMTLQRVRPEHGRNRLYGAALVILMLALLTHYGNVTHSPAAAAAEQIEQQAQPGDAVLYLQPLQTEAFANAYHGDLPVYGFFARDELAPDEATWLDKLRRDYERLWVVPNYAPPTESGWERPLRGDAFLLQETQLAGERVALYALDPAQPLTETGLGTVFGDTKAVAAGDAGGDGVTEETGSIRLDGYALTTEVAPGDALLLALRWESLRAVDENYHVFVHLLNASGERIAQRDGQPVQWMRPTSTWQPGEEIVDRYGLLLPEDIAPGQYTMAVGLYEPTSGERLAVSAGPGDLAIELGPIEVVVE